ncbi:rCG39989, isoform CRA_b [Rattus norvegicus]|uniref:RCG39989, isoform CRA_b n=1 Tax=Rattus norvegicus TaxID=10116 RepID=A6I616_RAT|nr:rCG39989, isoform CRA_b [Rattus norvegicus]
MSLITGCAKIKKCFPHSEKPTSLRRSVLGVENRGHGKYITPELCFSQEAAYVSLLSQNIIEMKKWEIQKPKTLFFCQTDLVEQSHKIRPLGLTFECFPSKSLIPALNFRLPGLDPEAALLTQCILPGSTQSSTPALAAEANCTGSLHWL